MESGPLPRQSDPGRGTQVCNVYTYATTETGKKVFFFLFFFFMNAIGKNHN